MASNMVEEYMEGLRAFDQCLGPQSTTKSGSQLYDGSAGSFESWKLRTLQRLDAAKAQPAEDKKDYEVKKVMSHILDGLYGDAELIARELGRETLCKPDGAEKLDTERLRIHHSIRQGG